MTEHNPSLLELIDELGTAQEKFREEAETNRRKRINSEPPQRQDTYGDQPEREFVPQVFLSIPHKNIRPGVATFTQPTFTVISDDVGSVTIDLRNTSIATVVFGSAIKNWIVSVTVLDGNGDGTVTIEIDTTKAGLSQYAGTDVFSTHASSDSIRSVTRETIPDHRLDEGNYDLSAEVDGTETDVAVLEKRRSSSTSDGDESDTDGTDSETGGNTGARGGEARQRPLPRRPTAPPPLRSSGMTVKRNGGRTEFIEAGKQYTVEVMVENGGGLAASNANVELFIEHRPATATIDPDGGVLDGARQNEFRATGYTTLPPGHKFVGVAYDDRGGSLTHDTILWRSTRGHSQVDSVGETVNEDRTFDIAPYLGDPATSSFRLRLYWTTGLDLTKDKYYPDTKQARTNYLQDLENNAVELVDKPGQIVSGQPSNPKGPLDLESTIQEASLVQEGQSQVTVPSSGAKRVSFDYTAPASRTDRVLTVFYARTYSLAPEDSPGDWNALDHTVSRHMGRTECNWRNASAN